MSKIAIFFAEGYEEIEALAVVDVCRRLKLEIDMVSITEERAVTGAHGISVGMDKVFGEIDCADYDMLVLPGGMPGTRNLEACAPLMEQIDAFYENGKYIGAICAAPFILGRKGLLKGKNATCFPGFEDELLGANLVEAGVVIAETIVTAKGAGVAWEFGAAICSGITGEEKALQILRGIQWKK